MDGILICYGPGIIKQHLWIERARIQDLAPTILYMMDQMIPADMDGSVLLDIFTDEFKQQNSVKHCDTPHSMHNSNQQILTEQEEAILAEMLRSLGYVN